ncbi:protease complex subunit PrcB family protein [Thermosediminibacter oceani]|uniref:PrcB C-terminal domain-containing protein n=1 Tax=Thermosediminibacter oceani (strain ATCC BAA-1034 / DSM 16646 / JW/IW-1228P) TaxID=555079 RepID=D9RZT7_THEOJ|nr:protease complex subunit PrcB family protein [Thermosediminibacter oceani]ADL08714.1 hypothetical protein Toce_1993 [Thermosediminibacter oceani DSM 16646]
MKTTKVIFINFLVLLMAVVLITGCRKEAQEPATVEPVMGDIKFEVIAENSVEFQELLKDETFRKWYDEKKKIEGFHAFDGKGKKYILVSAGEKPTGGYSVEVLSVTGRQDDLYLQGRVKAPAKDQMVTQVITYPSVLISVPVDERQVTGELKTEELKVEKPEEPQKPEGHKALKGEAVFLGQIDNNSIEVKEGDTFQVYRLSPDIKDRFDSFNLKENDRIQFMYYVNEHNQRVMTELKKMP